MTDVMVGWGRDGTNPEAAYLVILNLSICADGKCPSDGESRQGLI